MLTLSGQGAIDLLIFVYKDKFKSLGGYLVDMQKVITDLITKPLHFEIL